MKKFPLAEHFRKYKKRLPALAMLLLGLLLGKLFFSGSKTTSAESNDSHTEQSNEIWTCSMHPQIRQSSPGDCPICGMELIPVATLSAAEEVDVHMSPTAMKLADVQTMQVVAGSLAKNVRLNGKVQVDERLVSTQSSHIPGRVEKLLVNYTGAYIKAGQTIAYLYSPELVTAQEELLEAAKMQDKQPMLYEAARQKLHNWKLSDAQIDEVISSGNATGKFPVLANESGFVVQKHVNSGDYIKQGAALYDVADLSRVWVLFDVYESDLPWVKTGDMITFTVASLPGSSFSGQISYIDPAIDAGTRVARARVELVNKQGKLMPEMFVGGLVMSKTSTSSEEINVPKSAVMWTGKRSVVYVKQISESGVGFAMREVNLGPASDNSYQIESGLQVGEEIAVNGTFSIDAAAQLAGKPSMMSHNTTSPGNEQLALNEKIREALAPLINSYFNLERNLSSDNYEPAKEAAIQMKKELESTSMSVFTGGVHEVWMQHYSPLQKALLSATQSTSMAQLRAAFSSISDEVIAIALFFKPIDGDVFVKHCPMANANNGADWLSSDREIKNPYFGASMLRCGAVTQVISNQ
ncbi:efflux RND transporter periplasmic adaptor subunit [bacterium]|nr:efflux RND transporter periplasmic adaptor subunit [bacterium]